MSQRELHDAELLAQHYEGLAKKTRQRVSLLREALLLNEQNATAPSIASFVKRWIDETDRIADQTDRFFTARDRGYGSSVNLPCDRTLNDKYQHIGWELAAPIPDDPENPTRFAHPDYQAYIQVITFNTERGIHIIGASFDDHCGPPTLDFPPAELLEFITWSDPHIMKAIARDEHQRIVHWIIHMEHEAHNEAFLSTGLPAHPEVIALLNRSALDDDTLKAIEQVFREEGQPNFKWAPHNR